MAKMKYIVYQGGSFVIFPQSMNHNTFANNGIPIAAGFCSLESYRNQYDDLKYRANCWGKSEFLKLNSRGSEDALIISSGLNI